MGVPLVQQVSKVSGHVPRRSLQLLWVNLSGLQPLQVQHVLLTVGQLVNTGGNNQGSGNKLQYNVKGYVVAVKPTRSSVFLTECA